MTEAQKQTEGDLVGTDQDRGVHREGDLSTYTTSERAQLRALMDAGDASDADLDVLAIFANRSGLDPFLKQIYLVGRKTKTGGYRGEPERWETKWTVQAGIDGLRKVLFRAADAKDVDAEIGRPTFIDAEGNERRVWLKEWGYPPAVEVQVKLGNRTGWGIATWDEFVQTKRDGNPNSMWEQLGPTMLAKCAKAQAIRDVCDMAAGIFIPEEMQQAENRVYAEMRRVDSPKHVERGSSGLQAAIEQAPAQEEVTWSDLGLETREKIEAAHSRDDLQEAMDGKRELLGEAEYEQLHQAATARWREMAPVQEGEQA